MNTYSHEYSSGKIKYTDDLIYDFFKELYETDQLKDINGNI